MNAWRLPWKGGCRCGGIRFEVSEPPLLTGACHCTGCRKMSASAFSLTITVPAHAFAVTEGEPVVGGLKGPQSHHFHCPDCLSWIYTRAEGFDWFVNVRATMLDDDSWFEPFVEVWAGQKLPWAATAARHSFEADPPIEAWEALMKDYAVEGRRPDKSV